MSRLSAEDEMGDTMSPYEQDNGIPDYGQFVIEPQNAVRLATSSDTHFGGHVGEGGGDIEETGKDLFASIGRLGNAILNDDMKAATRAANDVNQDVQDVLQEAEDAANKGDADKLTVAEDILNKSGKRLALMSRQSLPPRDRDDLYELAPTPVYSILDLDAKYIGNKSDRDVKRGEIRKKMDEIDDCRKNIRKAKREIAKLKMEIRKDKLKSIRKRTGKYIQKIITPSEGKIPSVGGTLKAEGTLPVGDRLSDGSKGSAFFHSIIGCEDKEDFEHEFNIANRFFKKQYGLDFSDENPEVVKDGLKRTIGDVVTMEPFGLNHKITHKVETANMHIGELSPAGSDVYDGGFKVEVKQPIELGGNFEREAEDAVVPAGTKMLHGYMDLMDASGNNSAVRIAYRTKQPIVASGGNTYSMVGNLVSHEAPKLAIKRTLYVNKKGGDNHVVMATEFGH
jgi:hypothetical protein